MTASTVLVIQWPDLRYTFYDGLITYFPSQRQSVGCVPSAAHASRNETRSVSEWVNDMTWHEAQWSIIFCWLVWYRAAPPPLFKSVERCLKAHPVIVFYKIRNTSPVAVYMFRCDLVVSLQYFNLLNPLSTGPVQSIRQLFEWPGNWNVEQGACCLNNGHCWNQFKQISSSWDWKTGVGEENGQKLNYDKRRPENIIKFHHIISSAITWWMPHWCALDDHGSAIIHSNPIK